jgi:hypothetical protein
MIWGEALDAKPDAPMRLHWTVNVDAPPAPSRSAIWKRRKRRWQPALHKSREPRSTVAVLRRAVVRSRSALGSPINDRHQPKQFRLSG